MRIIINFFYISQIVQNHATVLFSWITACICFPFFKKMLLYSLIYFGHASSGMWDLCSQTRDQTGSPALAVRSINHWTTGEGPVCFSLGSPVSVVFPFAPSGLRQGERSRRFPWSLNSLLFRIPRTCITFL